MKIYTLESKNEVLSILTHKNNISYRDFKRMCLEANDEAENDYYILKDMLSDYNIGAIVEDNDLKITLMKEIEKLPKRDKEIMKLIVEKF